MANGEQPARALEALHSWTYRSWLAYGSMALFFVLFNIGCTVLVVQIKGGSDTADSIQGERVRGTYQQCVRDRDRNRALVHFLHRAHPPNPEDIDGFAETILPYHVDCARYTKWKTGEAPGPE